MGEEITSYKLACVIARFLDEKVAKDISILNISNVSSFADYFVICSAQTNTQVKALTENLADKVKTTFARLPLGRENDAKNRWNLIDYGDVVVHILHQEDEMLMLLKNSGTTRSAFPQEHGSRNLKSTLITKILKDRRWIKKN